VHDIRVIKFGGSSVADAAAFLRAAAIVRTVRGEGAGLVVVTSAMAGTTDALEVAFRRAADRRADEAERLTEPLFERHLEIARTLLEPEGRAGAEAELESARSEIAEILRMAAKHPGTRPALRDELLSFGERLLAPLLTRVLERNGLGAVEVDARLCIRTDDVHGGATPDRERTTESVRRTLQPHLDAGRLPVLGGFIGSTAAGATTTLGRGGSDFTASLVGAALGAKEIQIWTDVDGFLTADPRVVAGARTIRRLSYEEAAELAYFGAKVLHPRTIQPAVELEIPVLVLNSYRSAAPGTRIDARREASPRGIKAIAHKRGITIVRVSSARMLGAYGFLRALFEVFERHRTAVDIIATSEVSVSLTVDDTSALAEMLPELEELGEVGVEPECAILCVVGEGLRSTPGVAARVFGTLSDINIALVSHGASSTNLTFAIRAEDADRAVTRLHRAFFEDAPPTEETACEDS
jgi:aspartate kinase